MTRSWPVIAARPEQVMADEPLLPRSKTPELGARHEEDAPALQPQGHIFASVSARQDRQHLLTMPVEVAQPGIGGFFVMCAAPVPLAFELQVILEMQRK